MTFDYSENNNYISKGNLICIHAKYSELMRVKLRNNLTWNSIIMINLAVMRPQTLLLNHLFTYRRLIPKHTLFKQTF